MSVTSGPVLSFPSAPRRNLHGFSLSFHPVQPTNDPPIFGLNRFSSGRPHFGQSSPVSSRTAGAPSFACFSVSLNVPQNSSSTSRYSCFRVSMSSSSSSKWLVNFRSMIFGKFATRKSVTTLPISVAKNRPRSCVTYLRFWIVLMMLEYVEGRPTPSFSIAFTKLASLNRGGGWVKCCVSKMSRHGRTSFSFTSGSVTSSCLPAGARTRR